jgi:hypothetical protein
MGCRSSEGMGCESGRDAAESTVGFALGDRIHASVSACLGWACRLPGLMARDLAGRLASSYFLIMAWCFAVQELGACRHA